MQMISSDLKRAINSSAYIGFLIAIGGFAIISALLEINIFRHWLGALGVFMVICFELAKVLLAIAPIMMKSLKQKFLLILFRVALVGLSFYCSVVLITGNTYAPMSQEEVRSTDITSVNSRYDSQIERAEERYGEKRGYLQDGMASELENGGDGRRWRALNRQYEQNNTREEKEVSQIESLRADELKTINTESYDEDNRSTGTFVEAAARITGSIESATMMFSLTVSLILELGIIVLGLFIASQLGDDDEDDDDHTPYEPSHNGAESWNGKREYAHV